MFPILFKVVSRLSEPLIRLVFVADFRQVGWWCTALAILARIAGLLSLGFRAQGNRGGAHANAQTEPDKP